MFSSLVSSTTYQLRRTGDGAYTSIDVESTEDSPALLELVGDEGDDVEGSVVDSTEADGNAGSDTLGRAALMLAKFRACSPTLVTSPSTGELHVVGAVRDNLGAGHTHHHFRSSGSSMPATLVSMI